MWSDMASSTFPFGSASFLLFSYLMVCEGVVEDNDGWILKKKDLGEDEDTPTTMVDVP
ncbi:hypothetical protein Sjap_011100 [Stephania japonica]|uniref:Uncharacterized protein n=1 Tax=Stephania japonica TaxID=461633 RepID=A0AAP0P4R5_9MAGN